MRLPYYKGMNQEGETFGSLTVVRHFRDKPYGSLGKFYEEWEVVCSCGNVFTTNKSHIVRGQMGCNQCYGEKTRGSDSVHWKGGKYVTGYFISKVKQRLVRPSKTLVYDLSIEFLDNLYELQDKRCALSGLPISFENVASNTTEECSASLDRVDSSKGYTEDNVQFIHKIVNVMKQAESQVDFIEMCISIADYQRGEHNVI